MKNDDAGYGKRSSPDPRCVFLLVHGLGTHSGRWDAMADFFLRKNITSYSVDLPELNRIRDYYIQILRVREIASKENPGRKIFLIGESLGGLASFLFAAGHPGLFEGLVCMSPAFASRKKFGFFEALKMIAPVFYDPSKRVAMPFDSSMCTRDADYRKKLDNDPREYRSSPAGLILDIFIAQSRAGGALKRLKMPVLFLVSGGDMIVDPAISRKIFDRIPSEDKTFVEFPEMYHALSIESGKEAVFEELLKWAGERS